ncbi:MAG TPA: DUF308 domain-containing protein [Methylomirabilota bacterium]
MRMATLVRNWWMMAARGVFAMAFGAVLVLWPTVTLSVVVALFAAYAMLDGAWAMAAATWTAERGRRWDAWPVAVEGLASLAIGVLALVSPWVPRQWIYVIAFWGLVTGGLELLTALAMPRQRAVHWIMGTAAVSSLFLAALIMLVPLADAASGVALIAAYTITFGVLMISAAVRFRDAHTTVAAPSLKAVSTVVRRRS